MADSDGGILGELEAVLTEQLGLARNEQWDDVAALFDRADSLLSRAVTDNVAAADPQATRRIDALHCQLCLVLAAGRSEVAEQLARLRRGRSPLRAYQNSHSMPMHKRENGILR